MATITRSVDRINNATVIDSVAPAPCSPILTVFVMKAATNGSSARRIAHSQLCAASSGSRPAQCTPAMMTAYIPEVDSCYVADLTHSLLLFFPSRPLTKRENLWRDTGERRGARVNLAA